VKPRHALGLPAGSVRALLGFGVLGILWALVLRSDPDRALPLVFVYLQVLMGLILLTFFAAHGKSIGPHVSERSPLGLPRGSVRFLLLAGYAGMAGFLFYHHRDFETPPKGAIVFLLAVLMSGFFIGYIVTAVVRFLGRGQVPGWFQDIQAWFALLGMLGLAIVAIVYGIINPSVAPNLRLDMGTLEAILTGVVGFYFGARA
jgi:hypothetical protein